LRTGPGQRPNGQEHREIGRYPSDDHQVVGSLVPVPLHRLILDAHGALPARALARTAPTPTTIPTPTHTSPRQCARAMSTRPKPDPPHHANRPQGPAAGQEEEPECSGRAAGGRVDPADPDGRERGAE